MNKIRTIFERDWSGTRGVIDKHIEDVTAEGLDVLTPTEKLDGTNIRVTLRNGVLVRLEKRKNPSKVQKSIGIVEPWYIDALRSDPSDKYIFEAAENIDPGKIPDGEHSAEAVGPMIQGNPLKLDKHMAFLLDYRLETTSLIPILENVPSTFNELKEWLPKQKSKVGNDCGIEGIVWQSGWSHPKIRTMNTFKIKLKDFK